jgi:hypothetical protein
MKQKRATLVLAALAMLIGFGPSALPAYAGYTVTIEQPGANVVASGSGSFDLTDLSFNGTASSGLASINQSHHSNRALFILGSVTMSADLPWLCIEDGDRGVVTITSIARSTCR